MKLTNDTYLILISTKTCTERYYRDTKGWLKVSSRGRIFRMTAEQVLNHVLPALAGIKPHLSVKVEHRKDAHPRLAGDGSPHPRADTTRGGSHSDRNVEADAGVPPPLASPARGAKQW